MAPPDTHEAQARALMAKALTLSKADACEVNLDGNTGGNIRYARNTVSTAGATEDMHVGGAVQLRQPHRHRHAQRVRRRDDRAGGAPLRGAGPPGARG